MEYVLVHETTPKKKIKRWEVSVADESSDVARGALEQTVEGWQGRQGR